MRDSIGIYNWWQWLEKMRIDFFGVIYPCSPGNLDVGLRRTANRTKKISLFSAGAVMVGGGFFITWFIDLPVP